MVDLQSILGLAGPANGLQALPEPFADAHRCAALLQALGRHGELATPTDLSFYRFLFAGACAHTIDARLRGPRPRPSTVDQESRSDGRPCRGRSSTDARMMSKRTLVRGPSSGGRGGRHVGLEFPDEGRLDAEVGFSLQVLVPADEDVRHRELRADIATALTTSTRAPRDPLDPFVRSAAWLGPGMLTSLRRVA
jgi:hypothetical protein